MSLSTEVGRRSDACWGPRRFHIARMSDALTSHVIVSYSVSWMTTSGDQDSAILMTITPLTQNVSNLKPGEFPRDVGDWKRPQAKGHWGHWQPVHCGRTGAAIDVFLTVFFSIFSVCAPAATDWGLPVSGITRNSEWKQGKQIF